MSYLNDVFRQTADEGYFDFARCQRPDGTIYGSPTGKCKKGTLIGDKEETGGKRQRSNKGMRLTEKIKSMSAADLKKVAKDPRLSDRQRGKLEKIIKAKESSDKAAESKTSSAAVADKGRKTRDLASDVSPQIEKKSKKWDAKIEADAEVKKRAEEGKTVPKEKRVGRTTQEVMDRQILRGEVKLDANALAFNPMYQGKTQETLSTLKSSYKTMKGMMKDPFFNTPANRARLINTRIAIWRTEKAIRESSAATKIDPKSYEKDLKNSPKYKTTPGSTKTIAKAKTEDLPKLEKRMKTLSDKLSSRTTTKEEAMKIGEEMLDLNRRMMVARGDSRPAAPNLRKIYEEQGFNAKPELVGTATDLSKRKDLLTNPDGTNVILYRGVTTREFSDQFKGLGPDGDQHFPGRGIFGNGSYAGAASFHDPGGTAEAGKIVAASYAGERKDLASKVTAFGLRKDANVNVLTGDYNERNRQYDRWMDEVRDRADRETGYRFLDVGEAAAAVGIHAYQVPQRDGDYYVVLNRGAVVAAMDSQLSDDTGLR